MTPVQRGSSSILREAELSAGAVYRYFASKDEIVAAIAAEALRGTRAAFEPLVEADPPPPIDEAFVVLCTAIQERGEISPRVPAEQGRPDPARRTPPASCCSCSRPFFGHADPAMAGEAIRALVAGHAPDDTAAG